MAFFDELEISVKKDVIQGQKSSTLQQMYVILIRLGINPESFDPSSFTETSYEDQGDATNQSMLLELIERFNLLDNIENSLESATPAS